MAEGAEAGAIVVVETGDGATARALAAVRPDVPVVAISPSIKVCRQLIVSRSIYPIHAADASKAVELARGAGFAPAGEPVVLVSGSGAVSIVE